jgi:hypothetical protein
VVRSRLDETTLTAIAKRPAVNISRSAIWEGLRKCEAVETTVPTPGGAIAGVDRYHWPIALALILMVGNRCLARGGGSSQRPMPGPGVLRNSCQPRRWVDRVFWVLNASALTNVSTNAVSATMRPPESAREFTIWARNNCAPENWPSRGSFQAGLTGRTSRATVRPLQRGSGAVCARGGGTEEGPSANSATTGGTQAAEAAAAASQNATEALASEEVQKMVAAYLRGRGAKKELRAALSSVQRAMEAHVKTLLKWRRSLGDFQSALELNPADTNARTTRKSSARHRRTGGPAARDAEMVMAA